MPLQIDSILRDRYRIVSELGHGGMGAVYRARDENLGVEVAIKENLFVSPESERQFRREANLLASLRHSHLPRVTDHFVIPEQGQYLVMDFIPGEDAKAVLDKTGGPLPERDVVHWGHEILDALNYLHNRPQPILHRDIKPGNIKITPDGRAVLVDFGLAKIHDTSQSTTVGAKAYTPGFAPPEQYGLGRTDPRTDIYALGATLYNLLTLKMPADSLERAMGQKQLVPVRELNPSVSVGTAQAIERALGVKPEERFATAADFSAALPNLDEVTTPARTDATTLIETPRPAVTPPPPTANRTPLFIGIGVVLVLALAGGGLWAAGFFGGGATPPPGPTATAPALPTVAPATIAIVAAVTDTPTPRPTETLAPTVTVPPSTTPTVTLTAPPSATPRGGGSGRVAFVSDRDGSPQIYLLDINNPNKDQGLKPLTHNPDGACQPAWSPDGQKILFISPCASHQKDNYRSAIIYVMDADGSNVQPLITRAGGAYDPAWSKNGIAYTFFDGQRPQIYLAGLDGQDIKKLSEGTSADSAASWSPDGEKVAFLNTTRGGRPTLYWMTKDGGFGPNRTQPDQITRDIDAGAPAWSPKGDLIAFLSGTRIYVVKSDARGFGVQDLTGGVGPNDTPAWSPDGRWIIFESWRDNANHDIYIMTSTGSTVTRLTEDAAWDYQPAWRP